MREIFDAAYEAFCDAKNSLALFAWAIAAALIYLTTPFWVIPYAIIKRVKEDKDNG